MTGIGPAGPPGRPLDAATIRRLFDRVSAHLREARSFNHHLMIAGGAALALLWEDRLTRDVDVLEHRFRTPTHLQGERRTRAVDFISMRFPAELVRAARLVAEAERLPPNWLNGAVAIFTPACDLRAQALYRSECLVVEAPSREVLLAMKLHAGRGQDLEDAARLARATGITEPGRLLDLVSDAYGSDAVTAGTSRFAERALVLAANAPRSGPQAD